MDTVQVTKFQFPFNDKKKTHTETLIRFVHNVLYELLVISHNP